MDDEKKYFLLINIINNDLQVKQDYEVFDDLDDCKERYDLFYKKYDAMQDLQEIKAFSLDWTSCKE